MKKNVKTIVQIVIAFVVIALIVWKIVYNKHKKEADSQLTTIQIAEIPVRVYNVDTLSASKNAVYSNYFAPMRELNLASETSGRVIEVLLKEGDKVAKNQPLIKIDNTTSAADLEVATEKVEKVKAELARFKDLLGKGGVSKQDVDNKKLELEAAQGELTKAKKRMNDAFIVAPIGGQIFKKFVEVGTMLSPGSQICQIVDGSELKLVLNIPDYDIRIFNINEAVKISCDALPEKYLKGKVVSVANKADASLKYAVEIKLLENPNNVVLAGMFGRVVVAKTNVYQGILIPRDALIGSIADQKVFIVDSNNIVHSRKVQIGGILDSQIEIKGGLNIGDKVVISGAVNIEDDTKVKIVK